MEVESQRQNAKQEEGWRGEGRDTGMRSRLTHSSLLSWYQISQGICHLLCILVDINSFTTLKSRSSMQVKVASRAKHGPMQPKFPIELQKPWEKTQPKAEELELQQGFKLQLYHAITLLGSGWGVLSPTELHSRRRDDPLFCILLLTGTQLQVCCSPGPVQTHEDCPALRVCAADGCSGVELHKPPMETWKESSTKLWDRGKKEQTCLVQPSFSSTLFFFLTYDLIFSKISLYFGIKQFVKIEMLSKANIHSTCGRPKDFLST